MIESLTIEKEKMAAAKESEIEFLKVQLSALQNYVTALLVESSKS